MTYVTLMIDCLKEIVQIARFSVLQDALCGLVDRRASINRETSDGEVVIQVGYVWQPGGALWGMSSSDFVCK